MKKSKPSSVRKLEEKAQLGDIKAAFQLYEFYRDGKYVDENQKLATKYASQTLKLFKGHSLHISDIKLIDFRVYQSTEFKLIDDSNNQKLLKVIVGVNGAGKTALLDAISKCLSWLIQRIKHQDGNGDFIDDDMDIHIGAQYASIITQFSLNATNLQYEIELSKSILGSHTSRNNKLMDIRQLANIYKLEGSLDQNTNLPIMAYYGVERSLDINKKDRVQLEETSRTQGNKYEGFDKSLNGTADFGAFFKWFKYCSDIVAYESDSDKDQAVNSLDAIQRAVHTFMPEIDNLRIQIAPIKTMLIDKAGVTLRVEQLSQGEKSLLALIADIVRRLVLLNPSLDDPLNGNGIVLIDEIDLHLHPAWQQKVIPSLLSTFPNIQFILTTHSPQVLSTIRKECILVVGENSEGNIVASTPYAYSYGEPSNDVLQSIMHVDPQPPVDEKEKLQRLTALVDQGLYENPDAIELRKELEQSLNKNHPQLLKIDRSIHRQKVLNQ